MNRINFNPHNFFTRQESATILTNEFRLCIKKIRGVGNYNLLKSLVLQRKTINTLNYQESWIDINTVVEE